MVKSYVQIIMPFSTILLTRSGQICINGVTYDYNKTQMCNTARL